MHKYSPVPPKPSQPYKAKVYPGKVKKKKKCRVNYKQHIYSIAANTCKIIARLLIDQINQVTEYSLAISEL